MSTACNCRRRHRSRPCKMDLRPALILFFPSASLVASFCGKFAAGLRSAFHRSELQFHGSLLPLAQPRVFSAWLRVLFRHDWVVYSKRPFGVTGAGAALSWRIHSSRRHPELQGWSALSAHNVIFRWRDPAHGKNKKRLMPLDVDQFLRRFLLHVLPPGFVRIRNFGFLANRKRATLLPPVPSPPWRLRGKDSSGG